MTEDRRPHSRACGIAMHSHGSACHPNCPTCRGQEMTDTLPLTRPRKCLDCFQILDHFLRAPDPFTIGEEILACPMCHSVLGTTFAYVCDEPGCTETATCWAGDPRRSTCGVHARFLNYTHPDQETP